MGQLPAGPAVPAGLVWHPAADDFAAAYAYLPAKAALATDGEPETGDGGGVFDLDTRGAVMLAVTPAAAAGPPAAEVADALAGRPPDAAVLGELPASSRAALSRLAGFLNTP